MTLRRVSLRPGVGRGIDPTRRVGGSPTRRACPCTGSCPDHQWRGPTSATVVEPRGGRAVPSSPGRGPTRTSCASTRYSSSSTGLVPAAKAGGGGRGDHAQFVVALQRPVVDADSHLPSCSWSTPGRAGGQRCRRSPEQKLCEPCCAARSGVGPVRKSPRMCAAERLGADRSARGRAEASGCGHGPVRQFLAELLYAGGSSEMKEILSPCRRSRGVAQPPGWTLTTRSTSRPVAPTTGSL